jgi:hypothetical protein
VPPIDGDLPSVEILATDPIALGGTSSGAFTLIVSTAPTNNLVVDLAASGSASQGVDYQLLTNGVVLPTNAVVIPAGFLAVDILVQPLPETVNTGNQSVVLSVMTSTNYNSLPGRSGATVTIVDDIFNIPPPSVEIITPTNGSLFWFGTNITLTAQASDSGATVASVSFYADDAFLGKTTNSPYSLDWTNARAGRYTLFARAVNSVGQSYLSAPVNITVTNVIPSILLSSPTNGSVFNSGQSITLEADSSDALNPITNVTFYANGRVLDSIAIPLTATSPYTNTFTWTNVHAGVYIIQASATDTERNRVFSRRALINVSRP